MLWIGFFLIKIALRADVIRTSPGDVLVAAEHYGRHSHVGHPRDIEGTAAKMHFVPTRDGLECDVWIARDHRPVAGAAITGNHPIVTASALRISCCRADRL